MSQLRNFALCMLHFNRLALCCVLAAVLFDAPALALRAQLSPDQRIVETFVSTFKVPPSTTVPWNTTDPFNSTDVCGWKGVLCDPSINVEVISFPSMNLGGTVDFTKLPPRLNLLELFYNQFTGNADLTNLPPALEKIRLTGNRFTGPLALDRLPSKVKSIDVESNQFSGPLNLTHLPQSLGNLILRDNFFTGSVDLGAISGNMYMLNLGMNNFTGHVDLTHLPSAMESLKLDFNHFSGSVDLTKLPQQSQFHLELSHNPKICGNATLPASTAQVDVFMPSQCNYVSSSTLQPAEVWVCPPCP